MHALRQHHTIPHYLIHDYAIYIYLFLWNGFWAVYLDNLLLWTGWLVLLHNLIAYPVANYRAHTRTPVWWSYFLEDVVLFLSALLVFIYAYWLHFNDSDLQTNLDASFLLLLTWGCLSGQKYWQRHHPQHQHPLVEMQLQQPFFIILIVASLIIILEPALWLDKIIACFFCFCLMLFAILLSIENWLDFKKGDRR